jgi:hypothetical protein
MYSIDVNDIPLVIGDTVLYDLEEYGINAVVKGRLTEISEHTISIEWDDEHYQNALWYTETFVVSPSYIIEIINGCAPSVPDIHEKQ